MLIMSYTRKYPAKNVILFNNFRIQRKGFCMLQKLTLAYHVIPSRPTIRVSTASISLSVYRHQGPDPVSNNPN